MKGTVIESKYKYMQGTVKAHFQKLKWLNFL